MTDPATDRIVAFLAERESTCGITKIVAIDGRSGAGKSTLAEELGTATGGHVVDLDYPGWHGLSETPQMVVEQLLRPIARGEPGVLPHWDWANDRPGDGETVPASPLLILDGCGSGSRVIRPYVTVLVWIDGPADVRRRRAMARDGAVYEPWWDTWAAQENELFAAEGTEAAADLHLDR